MKTYTNGNREITLTRLDSGQYIVTSNVYDGTKWQYGHPHTCKTLGAAERSAQKQVSAISRGWTQFPAWTITETQP